MRPYLERLPSDPESSLSRLNRRMAKGIPFQWHHHPEYELTLTLNSRGQRFIGDHVGDYDDGDFVLVGPNLPHTWFSRGRVSNKGPHVALVIWFHPNWAWRITQDFVEFRRIGALLGRAARGLKFSRTATKAVRGEFESLFSSAPAQRISTFLGILDRLSSDRAQQLASRSPHPEASPQSRERIDRILTYIHSNYAEPVSLAQLAGIASLSKSGLHRHFLKHTGRTISDYLIHMRIGDACARLSGTTQPINLVADAVGYASLANFNRQFRNLKRLTPREYRRLFS
jgi:AraC-like DNA-binding protein